MATEHIYPVLSSITTDDAVADGKVIQNSADMVISKTQMLIETAYRP